MLKKVQYCRYSRKIACVQIWGFLNFGDKVNIFYNVTILVKKTKRKNKLDRMRWIVVKNK